MENVQSEEHKKPTGFDDYLSAARVVVDNVVGGAQLDLINTPGLIDDTRIATHALATLDNLLTLPSEHDPSTDLLTYRFAYKLFMSDTAVNSPDRYNELLGIINVIKELEAEYELLSPHDKRVIKIDELMVETATAIGTAQLAEAMSLADTKVNKDTRVKGIARKIGVFLGLIDDEEHSVDRGPADASTWSLRTYLYDLAVARQRLLAGQIIESEPQNAVENDRSEPAIQPLRQ